MSRIVDGKKKQELNRLEYNENNFKILSYENMEQSIDSFYEIFQRICDKHYKKLNNYRRKTKFKTNIFIIDIQNVFSEDFKTTDGKISHETIKIFQEKKLINIIKTKYPDIDYWIFYNNLLSANNINSNKDYLMNKIANLGEKNNLDDDQEPEDKEALKKLILDLIGEIETSIKIYFRL